VVKVLSSVNGINNLRCRSSVPITIWGKGTERELHTSIN